MSGSLSTVKVFIGVLASVKVANGHISGEKYYMSLSDLATIVRKYTMNSYWEGIMLWDAGFSDANVIDRCTYAQQSKHILYKDSPCSGSGTGTTVTKILSPTSPLNSTSFVIGPFISQWGQVSVLFSQVPTNS
jgi:chitinase